MKLLETMEKTLKSVLDDDDELDTLTPVMIAKNYNKSIVAGKAKETFIHTGIAKRSQLPPNLFEHNITTTARADKAKAEQEEKEKKNEDIEFNGEVRELLKFDKGVFEKNEPVANLDDSFFGISAMLDDHEKEVDLSNIQGENNPLAKY